MTDSQEMAVKVTSEEAVGTSLAVRAQTEIQSSIMVAKAHPRDQTRAFGELLGACRRPTFAKKARYSFPRGGTKVEGASINLAREAARCWGNIRYGMTIIPTDDDDWIQLEAWAHDAETNTWAYAQDRFKDRVQRVVWEGGQKTTQEVKPKTERDRRELVNRRGSLAQRNCLLQILPFDLIEDAEFECTSTGRKSAEGDLQKDRKETIRTLVMAFEQTFAVTQAMLEEHLGHNVVDMDAGELTDLREVWRSLKDGHTVRGDHFDVGTVEDGAAKSLQDEVDAATKPKKKARAKKKKEPEKAVSDIADDSPLTLAEFWDMCDCTNFAPGEAKGAVEDLRAMAKELGLEAKMLFDQFLHGEEAPERPDDA